MANLDFPRAPTFGQQFTAANGVTYQWDAFVWMALPFNGSGPAGGDLVGTYPNPKIKPSANNGDVLTTVAGAAAWAAPPSASAILPVGMISDFAGPAAPTGWLLCQGQAVSRATYAALYTALGAGASPWGQGDGTTTFNVPDLTGRVTAGKEVTPTRLTTAGAGIDGSVLAAAGGTQTYAMTLAQMPTHNHTTSSGNVLFANIGTAFGTSSTGGSYIGYGFADTVDKGSSTAHQNTQPTIVINKIIKT